jgi:hypothetical protein
MTCLPIRNRLKLVRLLVVLGFVCAFVAGGALHVVLAHSANLDLLEAVLLKGEALAQLTLSEDVPTLPEKEGHEFQKHMERALDDIQHAMDEVQAAIAIEDSVFP